MMTPLYAELHRWAALPHAWGQCDCMLVLGDWVARVRGVDPFAALRGTYDSPLTCERATGFLSDPVPVAARHLQGGAGLARVDLFDPADPDAPALLSRLAPGDIAVIRRRDDPRWPMGALWTGRCWACKGPNGTTTLHPALVQPLAAWRVGDAG